MPQGSFTVYVVEDAPSIRRALNRLLRSVGYHAVAYLREPFDEQSLLDAIRLAGGKDYG